MSLMSLKQNNTWTGPNPTLVLLAAFVLPSFGKERTGVFLYFYFIFYWHLFEEKGCVF